MDFDFSPDTLALRDMLRRFIQKEAQPLEMKYFNAQALAAEERLHLRRAIEQMGLWGALMPEKYGGGGLDAVTACLIEEELGQTFVPVELGDVSPMLWACAGEHVPRYLEPTLAGERHCLIAAREPKAMRPEAWTTTAVLDSDDFILNGRKVLTAQPGPADYYLVFANAPAGLTAFLLDADSPGSSASANGDILLIMRDCRVSHAALLGQPGGALRLGVAAAPLAWIRTGARYVGLAKRLLAMAREHAQQWVALGAPLAARPAIQRVLAETHTAVESARWLVYHAAWLADKGEPIREAALQVRLFTGEMLRRAVDGVTLIYAGPGPSPEIEPHRLAHSVVPAEALELSLEYARAALAAEMLTG